MFVCVCRLVVRCRIINELPTWWPSMHAFPRVSTIVYHSTKIGLAPELAKKNA